MMNLKPIESFKVFSLNGANAFEFSRDSDLYFEIQNQKK